MTDTLKDAIETQRDAFLDLGPGGPAAFTAAVLLLCEHLETLHGAVIEHCREHGASSGGLGLKLDGEDYEITFEGFDGIDKLTYDVSQPGGTIAFGIAVTIPQTDDDSLVPAVDVHHDPIP